jgi:hypothetical protein
VLPYSSLPLLTGKVVAKEVFEFKFDKPILSTARRFKLLHAACLERFCGAALFREAFSLIRRSSSQRMNIQKKPQEVQSRW